MSKSLNGKTIAITGGARGIGRATAELFLNRGASVAIGDIDTALVEKTAAELAEKTGGQVIGLGLDVTDPKSFEEFLDRTEADFGQLDALVNNAGVMPTGSFLDEPLEVSDRQFAINVRGVIIGSKFAGRRFAQYGAGHLVNIASIAGLIGTPGVATYCASKFAVVGLGASLHQELEPLGVKVTTICPSFVNTELVDGLSPNWLTRQIGFVEPEDIANAIVDSVSTDKGGQRVVPTVSGIGTRILSPLPQNLRDRLTHLLGMHNVMLTADASKRAGYLERAEGAKK